jgi:hypothetical protein
MSAKRNPDQQVGSTDLVLLIPRCAIAEQWRVLGPAARGRGWKVEAGKRTAMAIAAPATAVSPAALLQPDLAFSTATYIMVPLYFIIAFFPRSKIVGLSHLYMSVQHQQCAEQH